MALSPERLRFQLRDHYDMGVSIYDHLSDQFSYFDHFFPALLFKLLLSKKYLQTDYFRNKVTRNLGDI